MNRICRARSQRSTSIAALLALLLSAATVPFATGQSPTFIRNPSSASVAAGMSKTISALASGAQFYQWTLNGSPLPDATNSSIAITNVQSSQTGEYRLVAANSSGSTTSNPALLVLGPVRGWGGTNFGQLDFPPSLTNATAIAAGERFGIAVLTNGAVAAWGSSALATNLPPGLTNVVQTATKVDHCLALRWDGTVVGWGNNYSGKTNVSSLINIASISVGMNHNLFVTSNHVAMGSGDNMLKQAQAPPFTGPVMAIAAGANYSLALRDDGTVTGWGPTNAPAGLSNVVAIAAGDAHGLALKADGTVVAWGANNLGQANVPAGLDNVVAIAAGRSHSLALRSDGTVVAWGGNLSGQAAVPSAAANVRALAAGADYSLALEGDGSPTLAGPLSDRTINQDSSVTLAALAVGVPPLVFQWRFNGEEIPGATNSTLTLAGLQPGDAGAYSVVVSNSLGVVTSSAATLAVRELLSIAAWGNDGSGQTRVPEGLSGAVAIAGGADHSLALLDDGSVVAWGSNHERQTNVPTSATNVVAIAAGAAHNVALLANGRVIGWGGYNPSVSNISLLLSPIVAIAAGNEFSLAIGPNGTVTQWGSPFSGIPRLPPGGVSGAIAIAAGDTHGVAAKSDGTVVAWTGGTFGNYWGQTNVPPSATNVVAVAAGYAHSLALRNDGTVVAWGMNEYGQTNVPVDLTNVAAIAACQYQSYALRSDGTIFGWGKAASGKLAVPSGLTNVVRLAAGYKHALALVGDSPPVFSTQPRGRTVIPGATVELTATASGTPTTSFQWRKNGVPLPEATNSWIQLTNFSAFDAADYEIAASNRHGVTVSASAPITIGSVIAWGRNSSEQTWIPAGLSETVQVDGGAGHSIALQKNGTVIQWGGDIDGEVPPNLPAVLSVSAGDFHNLALLADHSVAGWGYDFQGQATPPPDLTNAISVSGGNLHSVSLTSFGTVVAWGESTFARPDQIALLSDVTGIAAGRVRSLALKGDGTVFAWGYDPSNIPIDLKDVVAIAEGLPLSMALKADGTVAVWDEGSSIALLPPPGLSNVVAIAAGFYQCLALKHDGALVGWGQNSYDEADIPSGAVNVISIGSGWNHHLAILGDGKPVFTGTIARRSVRVGGTARLAALAVGAQPMTYRWQLNGVDLVGETNAMLTLKNASSAVAGDYQCVVSNALGSATNTPIAVTVTGTPLQIEAPPDGWVTTNGTVQLRITGLAGTGPVSVFASTNLINWEILLNNPPVSGTLDFVDPESTNLSTRFYQATEGP